MNEILMNLPIIIIALFIGFGGFLIIDAEKRQAQTKKAKEAKKTKNRADQ